MRKLFLTIGCVALLGMGVITVSCSKDSEKDNGKKDGKAYCKCLESAGSDDAKWDECEAMADKALTSKNTDYLAAFTAEAMACMDIDFE
jgi:hypothetical protein